MIQCIAGLLVFSGVNAPTIALPGSTDFGRRQVATPTEIKVVRQALSKLYARYDQAVRKNNAATLIVFLQAQTLPTYSRLHNGVTVSKPTIIAQTKELAKRLRGRVWLKLL